MATIVHTQQELESALKDKAFPIIVKGEYASYMTKKYNSRKKIKKGAIIGGIAVAAAGVIAAPLTGGSSLIGSAAGLTAAGLTIGTISISIGELAILCGFTLGMTGILKDRKVKVKFGKTEVEITEKV